MTLDFLSSDPLKNPLKQQIADRFGQAAPAYHSQAKMQQRGAAKLVDLLLAHRDKLPAGPILEIGCGTGFITQLLLNSLTSRQLEITDLSTKMLQFCQDNLVIPRREILSFHQLDAENARPESDQYAAIVGGFVLQWFHKPNQSVLNLINSLRPGGLLVLSFPTAQSFPEWRQVCRELDLPYTANPLPDPDLLADKLSMQTDAQLLQAETVDWVTVHSNAASFFRELKTIGASTAQQRLSPSQMRRLIQSWDACTDGNIAVHHQIAFWVIQRLS